MKVTDILNRSDRTLFSFELVPPLKGGDIYKIYDAIQPLMEFQPPFINITLHRDEEEYRQRPDGTIQRVIVTKRPGSVALAAAIMNRFHVEVVPHIVCGGASRHKIENELIDLHFLSIDNVMALRGDPTGGQRYFTPTPEGHTYASGLVEQVTRLNRGQYLDEHLTQAVPTDFCIGVAGYPEKHYEAPNPEADIRHLKMKVDAGAHYITTQMFFDNQRFFDFVDRCRREGITVPIIPGLKPISTLKHLEMLPRTFSIDIPADLEQAIRRCRSNAEINRVGIEWAIAQTRELKARGVPAVHYYTMGKSDNIREIVEATF